MPETFDTQGLIRAIIISIGAGLLVNAIGFAIDRERWKRVTVTATLGIVILLAAILYYSWPSLIRVPPLDGLSRAEAENLLVARHLQPQALPQYAPDVAAGRVVPHSQTPAAGLAVRAGTPVTFAISIQQTKTPNGTATGKLAVALFSPKSSEPLHCRPGGDGIYRCEIRGSALGASAGGPGILLWIRPVQPPSDTLGWYLQRPPSNGIDTINSDGSWTGLAQIGNLQYPPHEGDIVDVAASIADRQTVDALIAEPGVVLRNSPVGAASDIATRVVVTLK